MNVREAFPDTPRNARWEISSTRVKRVHQDMRHSPRRSTAIQDLHYPIILTRLGLPAMTYPVEDFTRESREEFIAALTPEERRAIVNELPFEERRASLDGMPLEERRTILNELPLEERRAILNELPFEERRTILNEMPPEERRAILN